MVDILKSILINCWEISSSKQVLINKPLSCFLPSTPCNTVTLLSELGELRGLQEVEQHERTACISRAVC
jgi:hypothetical protein